MKLTSIYQQLILNIVIPVILGLLIIGIFNYQNTQTILHQNSDTEKNFIYDEINSFIELQYVALSIIEGPMQDLMQDYSHELIHSAFSNTLNIENANLDKVRDDLGMDKENFDLYIINQDGIVVNTTFREDLYINFFSFGKEHKDYLINLFQTREFDSPQFFFEHKTKRYKKYCYQTTLDGKYIIEIGHYSKQADMVYEYMNTHLEEIPLKKPSLLSVDIFFLGEKPYPLNLKKEFIPEHLDVIPALLKGEKATRTLKMDNKRISYSYFYIKSPRPSIFAGSIVRIASDDTNQIKFMRAQGIKIMLVVLLSIIMVYLLIYFRSKAIVAPIKQMIIKTKNIANGNYGERVSEEGANEIAILSKYFNHMVNNIQERNNQIEEQSEFLYQANRKLNEAYKLLDHQKNLIENKQDDLTASINYAQRIQESLLPNPNDLQNLFPKSFIFYMPRDIVSGDFYWFVQKGNKIVLVISDCTGHGVPGAFMSMVGMTILHHLVNYERIFDPSVILSRLDTEICDLLVYRNTKNQRFEGMDTAICCIDLEQHELTFASAQRPIIIVRQGIAHTYKGSIYPIGEYYDDIQKIFSNTKIQLEDGDIIYLFTDGYTSQFNETNEKKFNYERFRKLLTDINHKQIKDQPAILHRTFEAWKGNNEQIDDILVTAIQYEKDLKVQKISARDFI